MPLKADQRYVGTVASGSGFYQSSKGTPGFQVLINSEAGTGSYTIWLTKKTKESGNAERDFKALGVSMDSLKDRAYRESLGERLKGTEISFGTVLNEYNGKTSVQVNWIASAVEGAEGGLDGAVAAFFGDTSNPAKAKAAVPGYEPPSDDDAPPF
jgi:hypothetical protein